MNEKTEVKLLKELVKEAELLSTLRHPNIVLFMGVVLEPPNFCLITEFVVSGLDEFEFGIFVVCGTLTCCRECFFHFLLPSLTGPDPRQPLLSSARATGRGLGLENENDNFDWDRKRHELSAPSQSRDHSPRSEKFQYPYC